MTSQIPQVQPEHYARQLADKSRQLQQLLAPFEAPPLDIFASAPSHYRQRCEFRLWHEGDDLYYVMFEIGDDPKTDRRRIRMDQYPVASQSINRLMPQLLDAIRDQPLLRQRLFQVEFLSTLSGEMLVTLIYHRPLTDAWLAAARQLEQQLDVLLIGRSRGQKQVLTRDYVLETFQAGTRTLTYQQLEGSFTQPNAGICQQMLNWARTVTRPATTETARDLLELYCGNGNFTLALADHFRQLLGTEISRTSVAAAQFNIRHNETGNVQIQRASAEEFSQAMQEPDGKLAHRLQLANYDFSTLLVDPPRAGLDAATLQLASRFERILYISCNPQTLADNLQFLCTTHRIEHCAFFDQFPYTHHAECGVYLVRR